MTSQRDREHIFERLRSGVVPERGLEAFAVGIERQRTEVGRLLDLAASGEGVFKFLRGGYGCGKTFMANLVVQDALERGFATSFVVVSDNDLHFHKFDELYRKVVSGLSTPACLPLRALLRSWATTSCILHAIPAGAAPPALSMRNAARSNVG